jgi:hypothetical protein
MPSWSATATTDPNRSRRSALRRGRGAFLRSLDSLGHQQPEEIASLMIEGLRIYCRDLVGRWSNNARLDAQDPTPFVYHEDHACCVSSCGEIRHPARLPRRYQSRRRNLSPRLRKDFRRMLPAIRLLLEDARSSRANTRLAPDRLRHDARRLPSFPPLTRPVAPHRVAKSRP